MPNIHITLRKGCSDAAIERAMKDITTAAYTTLENVLQKMVRVTVEEMEENCVVQGDRILDNAAPTVTFRVGPGRSYEARKAVAQKMIDILSRELEVPREYVRVYMESSTGDHFCIGGKLKDFSKKVN